MKRFLIITLVMSGALLYTKANLYSADFRDENSSLSLRLGETNGEPIEIEKEDDYDWNEFDIIHSTTSGGRPKSGLLTPIRGFSSNTMLKVSFYTDEAYTIEIEDNSTKAVIETVFVDPNITSETLIDLSDWNQGEYNIYFYKLSPKDENDYYVGEFTIF